MVISHLSPPNRSAVLEYVEGGWIFEGCGPPGGIGEANARAYLRDVVAGLMYLHSNVAVLILSVSLFVMTAFLSFLDDS